MGLIRVGERLTLVRQAERGQEPNAFDDRDRVVSRRDDAASKRDHPGALQSR